MDRNVALYPWYRFVQSLTFWQATWFLYFESALSAAEAILLYVVFDLSATVLEVPSGYMSDRLGRKLTLMASAICGFIAALTFVFSGSFPWFCAASIMLGGHIAFASGTDSALLYESLVAEGREDEIETQELWSWRSAFTGLAVAAFAGGVMAMGNLGWPFVASVVTAGILIIMTLRFEEPPHMAATGVRDDLHALRRSFMHPTLVWIFCLALVMYVFSHIPYVFGQPFIREALTAAGYGSQTPLVSGAVTAIMMLLSVVASLVAMRLRQRIGLAAILLVAFAMQIGLAAALALSNGLFVIGLLFLRMVPDSWSQPFLRARVQPLLPDGTRATYLSLQSLAGRILFAITLSIASAQAPGGGLLPYADMQTILAIYAGCGVLLFASLWATARRANV